MDRSYSVIDFLTVTARPDTSCWYAELVGSSLIIYGPFEITIICERFDPTAVMFESSLEPDGARHLTWDHPFVLSSSFDDLSVLVVDGCWFPGDNPTITFLLTIGTNAKIPVCSCLLPMLCGLSDHDVIQTAHEAFYKQHPEFGGEFSF